MTGARQKRLKTDDELCEGMKQTYFIFAEFIEK